jgi:hypothetical protein
MTQTQKNINHQATGLLIFQSDGNAGFYIMREHQHPVWLSVFNNSGGWQTKEIPEHKFVFKFHRTP